MIHDASQLPEGEIQELRHRAVAAGAEGAKRVISDAALARVYLHVNGDIGVAVDALAMDPRPGWLSDLLRGTAK